MSDKSDVEVKSEAHCKWCVYNDFACKNEAFRKECDFKDLSFKQHDIIERAKKEYAQIKDARAKIEQGKLPVAELQELAMKTADKVAGLQIMMRALQDHFDMSPKEIAEAIGVEKLSLLQQAKLAAKLYSMKNARGAKWS